MTDEPTSGWGASPGKAKPGGAAAPRLLLRRLREALAAPGDGQQRLDQIVRLIATSMVAEVCSVYLLRGRDMLELCATEGLKAEAVHNARLRVGEGLVGVIARDGDTVNTSHARDHPEFRYLPETGEEIYSSFLGVPIQRLGKVLGVLVVQNERPMLYNDEDEEALRVVAMVIAEIADAGSLLPPDANEDDNRGPFHSVGTGAADGVAIGYVHLHEPRLLLPNPIADDVTQERIRLHEAMEQLRADIDEMIESAAMPATGEHRDVMETYRLFANDKGWLRRLEATIATGLKAEAAVDAARSEARAKIDRARDPYLRERLNDMDDLAQRLLRRLMPPGQSEEPIPENAILVARAIGPGELMDYQRGTLAGIVLEEGSPSSHATIVARALDIPLVVQAGACAREANQGDLAIVNGDQGHVHFRPREDVVAAYEEKLTLRVQERQAFAELRQEPARTLDGHHITLLMNAGLSADLPSLAESGAEGVGLLRTELHFMLNRRMPTRDEQTSFYSHVLDKAGGKPVTFRTLDVGSDKVLPFLKQTHEENPALGWRAIRLGLDRPAVLKMQAQALLRAANGRPLRVMFPMVADRHEFQRARAILLEEAERLNTERHTPPSTLAVGAMLETPSLAFEDDLFFQSVDFISIGGNDLLQFFFAADRMNERTAGRYDLTSAAFLRMLRVIVERCKTNNTDLSFCGESAGRPLDALALAATGIPALSMRPAAVGPVKRAIRAADLSAVSAVISTAEASGDPIRQALLEYCSQAQIPV